jgi:hypothetical protein
LNFKVCPNILGKIKYKYNNHEYQLIEINSNVKINYNSITNEYYLLVPVTNNPINQEENMETLLV